MRYLAFLFILLATNLASPLKSQQEADLSSQEQAIKINLFRRGTRSGASGSSPGSPPAQHHGSRSPNQVIPFAQQLPQAASDARVSEGLRSPVSFSTAGLPSPSSHWNNRARSAKTNGWVFKKNDTPSHDTSLSRSPSLRQNQQPSNPKDQQGSRRERTTPDLVAPAPRGALHGEGSAIQAQQQQRPRSASPPWQQRRDGVSSLEEQPKDRHSGSLTEQQSNEGQRRHSEGREQGRGINSDTPPHTPSEKRKSPSTDKKAAFQHRNSESRNDATNAVKQLLQSQGNTIKQQQQTISRLRCIGQALCTVQGIDHGAFERDVQELMAKQSLQAQQDGATVQPHHDMTRHLINNVLKSHQDRRQLGVEQQQRQFLQQGQKVIEEELKRGQTPRQRQQLEQHLQRLRQQDRDIELRQMMRNNPQLHARPQLNENQRRQQPMPLQRPPQQQQQVTAQLQPQQISQLQKLRTRIQILPPAQLQQVQTRIQTLPPTQLQQLQTVLQHLQQHRQPQPQRPQLQQPQVQSRPVQELSIASTAGPPVRAPLVGQSIQQRPTSLQQAQPPGQTLQPSLRRAQFPSNQEMRRHHMLQLSNFSTFVGIPPFDRGTQTNSEEESLQDRPAKQQKQG